MPCASPGPLPSQAMTNCPVDSIAIVGFVWLPVDVLATASPANAAPDALNRRNRTSVVASTDCHAIAKLPLPSIATAGLDWERAVVLLASVSPPWATPAALYRWKKMSLFPDWPLVHTTTKLP